LGIEPKNEGWLSPMNGQPANAGKPLMGVDINANDALLGHLEIAMVV
jgi:hypothetical protein